MSYRLSPAARADGHRLHLHETLGSTNTEAMALARSGETGPLWVAAKRQEAGRGRRGSAWISADGNLAASLLWPVGGVAPDHVAGLGFVAGLALVRALAHCSRDLGSQDLGCRDLGCGKSGDAFRLKWPNDVLAEGAKLAGILLEAETLPGGRRAVVIGFGVNVARAPDGLPYPVTALARWRDGAEAGALFETLSDRFVEEARIWDGGRGFSTVRRRWLERAAGVGAPVSVRSGSETWTGVFDGIDEGGRLVILAPDGTRRTVTAGEVHFGTAATAA